MSARIGIIGGSGLYDIEGIEVLDELEIDTPFGKPSDRLILARVGNRECVFLPRHGRGHRIAPHEIPYRANIYAMKLLSVEAIVSFSAVGSLREEIAPGDFVIVDQFIDFTRRRPSSFFDGPVVAHVSMAEPTCPRLRQMLSKACKQEGVRAHDCGTYIAIEGPQFSTRAESHLFHSWGADVIGMTNMPEAKLAREAQICYATLAMATDYDCWRKAEEAVSVEAVLAVMQRNVRHAQQLLRAFLAMPLPACEAGCQSALAHAVISKEDTLDAPSRHLLSVLRGERP